MSSIFQNFRNHALPVSQTQTKTTTTEDQHNNNNNNNNNQLRKEQEADHVDAAAGGKLGRGLRRRLSSLSLKLQPAAIGSPAAAAAAAWAAFGRSKSVSEMGEYYYYAGNSVKKWWEWEWGWGWDWGWGWIMSRKPTFACRDDLEMNHHHEDRSESSMSSRLLLDLILGKGSWRHVFYKLRSELRKLVGFDNSNYVGLPQTVLQVRWKDRPN